MKQPEAGQQPFARNVLSLSAANLVGFIVSAVTSIILARALPVAVFGQYSWVFAAYPLMRVVLNLGLDPLAIREIERNRGATRRWLSFIVSVKLTTGTVTVLMVFFMKNELANSSQKGVLLSTISLALLADAFIDTVNPALASLNRFSDLAIFNLLGMFFSAGLLITGAFLGKGIGVLVVLFLAAKVLHLGVAFWFLRRNELEFPAPFVHFRGAGVWGFFSDAWPFFFTSSFSIVYAKVDVFMLGQMSTDNQVAFYSCGLRFVGVVISVMASIVSVLYPPMVARGRTNRNQLAAILRDTLRWLVIVGVVVGFALHLAASPLVILVFGYRYAAASEVLELLAWILILSLGIRIFSNALLAIDGERKAMAIGALAVSSNVALNFWLIPTLGAVGATCASLLSEAAVVVAYLVALEPLHLGRELGFTLLRGVLPVVFFVILGMLTGQEWPPALRAVLAMGLFVGLGGIQGEDIRNMGSWLRNGLPQ